MTAFPARLAAWAVDTLAALPEVFFPLDAPPVCGVCGCAARVSPCTECRLAADADDRIRAEACGEAECVEPPELSWGVDGATTDPVTFQEPTGWDVDCIECYPDVPAGVEAVPPSSPPAGSPDPSGTNASATRAVPGEGSPDCAIRSAPGEHPTSGLADLIAEVLVEHNPFDGAGGIECAPAFADFETPYSVDHLVHLSGMAEWRAHVAPLIAARIEKAMKRVGAEHALGNAIWLDRLPQ